MGDAATSQHWSRMPRWLGTIGRQGWRWGMLLPPGIGAGCQDGWREPLRREEPVAAWLARSGRSMVGSGRRQQSSAALVWASTGDGRGRWTSIPNRSLEEEQQIWFGIARIDAQATAEVGLSWPWLPRRIRHCGCRSRRDWGFCHLSPVQPTNRRCRSTPTRPLLLHMAKNGENLRLLLVAENGENLLPFDSEKRACSRQAALIP
ncbi:hypothetical protein BHM03_00009064 [Ensete ventricosum]|nr:hypothetical protein BHM03_00009064 [Ensete ventricosum]